jgi:hypothetical protein
MTPMTTKRRITFRLSPEDDAVFQSITNRLRTRFPNLTLTEILRATLREAAVALNASGIAG